MEILTKYTKDTLARAREVYGETNQILVSIEELNELAAVCAKYPRFDDKEEAVQKLREKVIDEVADVFNVLDHIQAVFHIQDAEAVARAASKAERINRWLRASSTLDISTKDRAVKK